MISVFFHENYQLGGYTPDTREESEGRGGPRGKKEGPEEAISAEAWPQEHRVPVPASL